MHSFVRRKCALFFATEHVQTTAAESKRKFAQVSYVLSPVKERRENGTRRYIKCTGSRV